MRVIGGLSDRARQFTRRGAGLAVVALLLAGPATAEDPAEHELLLFEQPVVTAAAKHKQSLSDAPSDVTIITGEQIHRYGYRTLSEALQSVRGFYRSYDRNYEYVGVRGFLRPGDYNDRILLLVNGHTYNDDIYSSATFGEDFGIDLEVVERIEVIRGPGSALYGSNALFAVINVVTKTGYDLSGFRSLVESGSYGRKRGQVSYGKLLENGLDVLVTGSVLDVDGHHDLYYSAFDTPDNNYGRTVNADAMRAYKGFIDAHWNDFNFQGGTGRYEKHVPTAPFGTTFGDNGTRTVDQRSFAEFGYNRDITGSLNVNGRLYWDNHYYHGTYIYGTYPDRVKNEDTSQSNWVGGELGGHWDIGFGHMLVAGTEYAYHPDATQKVYNLPGIVEVDDRRVFSTFGIFAEHEWALRPDLHLVIEVRWYRGYGAAIDTSPRGALVWNPSPDTTAKLMVGQAFRQPSIYEQYYYDPTAGQLPTGHLKFERMFTYEGSLQQRLFQQVDASVSVFHYDIANLIEQITVPGSTPDADKFQVDNGPTVRANGFDAEVRGDLPKGARARAAYAFQDVRQAGGQLLTNSPKHLGVGSVQFPLPFDVTGGAELMVVGPRHTSSGTKLSTAVIPNLSLQYQTPVNGLAVTAAFYNFFSQPYSVPGGAEHVQDSLAQDRFTYRLQIAYAF